MNSTIIEVKNALGEINSRVNEIEEWISELEDVVVEIIAADQNNEMWFCLFLFGFCLFVFSSCFFPNEFSIIITLFWASLVAQ